MASVRFQNISKRYNEHESVIDDVSLHIDDGEFVVFVGPSGCGKSTMLRMIAGLEDISDGELHIGDRLANDEPASRRGIAMVFQNYALYPHMTVAENMGFALRLAKTPKPEITRRVEAAADTLQIRPLLGRKPKELSGGQRQRVAIGRAIVRDPQVFLFDEPLSNLDAALRGDMRVELSKLHHTLGTTMIYVTHDQVEAMTLADRIVVFNGGKIQGIGTPGELYDNPPSLFVASFLGAPAMNLFDAHLSSIEPMPTSRLASGATIQAAVDASKAAVGDKVTLGIRPEHVAFSTADTLGAVLARITMIEYLGDSAVVHMELPGGGQTLRAKTPGRPADLGFGDTVHVVLPPEHCLLFDAGGQAFPRRP